ncbi:hypothetical protein G3T14_11265 [Methylobacterium sp. BTF04]|uniref:hypothetical protein n=1 Tax=Methylobacterium sp. BTF04 TaxID=2708300 RepID=UPI0013D5BD26|nr:hypothetical protein [Methylobacterium sp. BTF04]NEU12714.1 hypothetical protein [Methylobacterium sp. BTF04]
MAAARRSGARVREVRAERLARALAAPTPAARLAALDDPILTRADRRKLREHVGVSLAPESSTSKTSKRRPLANRLRVALASQRYNPVNLLICVFVGGSIVTALAFAWAHTGRGAQMSGLCRDPVFTWSDGTPRYPSISKGTRVIVRSESTEVATIAYWQPLAGYGITTVEKVCLVKGE